MTDCIKNLTISAQQILPSNWEVLMYLGERVPIIIISYYVLLYIYFNFLEMIVHSTSLGMPRQHIYAIFPS